ncbi:MAG: hypothetical protein C4291_14355 [Candidatus Dadabacteria bacterium]
MSIELALIPIAIAIAGAVGNRKRVVQDPPNAFRMETRIKDARLLSRALETLGCQSVVLGEGIGSSYHQTQIVFEPTQSGAFDAIFIGDIGAEHAHAFLSDLHDEYARQVQEYVYTNLVTRARERGLVLENAEVQQDNSIVLTFSL